VSGVAKVKPLLFVAALFLMPPSTDPKDYQKAPVYAYILPELLARVSTYTHEAQEGRVVLFCIADSPTAPYIHCVIRTDSDRLILEDVEPSERAT
jgi:hypothetical protein